MQTVSLHFKIHFVKYISNIFGCFVIHLINIHDYNTSTDILS